MESYRFESVTFSYPESKDKALNDISLNIRRGEFVILCGPSGCGKTTLLRHMKSCLTPHGIFEGKIFFEGKSLREVEDREQASRIGYVLQSPEDQVVTDKVWHELAFGLESLGYDTPVIRRRVAETAAFFGIEDWFYKNVNELSGGQKQLLSLASVMAMQPSVLVLDEPTSQLDPIAAGEFIALLGRINRELGTTVILTEHRLEEAFPFASRVIAMEKGSVICDGTPGETGMQLKRRNSRMFLAMPTAMRVWAALDTELECPVTVKEGSDFLSKRALEKPVLPIGERNSPPRSDETVLECRDIWFSYEKASPDVLKGTQLTVKKGEFYALLGGNGAGKTTLLKVLSGLCRPYRGCVTAKGRIGQLPQEPKTLFIKKTLKEDLYEVFWGKKIPKEKQDKKVAEIAAICGLDDLMDRHPYDLSGGEQQRSALAKVLLGEPEILFLDEPTKGFDAAFKVVFAGILQKLIAGGVTVLMVSHDVTFCAEYAHRCGMFFDGHIVAEGQPREFFCGNSFYTTPANRMARHIIPDAVTVEDIIRSCGGAVAEQDGEHSSEYIIKAEQRQAEAESRPIPIWRKVLAALSGAAAFGVLLYAAGITDLSSLINANGMSALGKKQLWLYGVLAAALITLILAMGKRSAYDHAAQSLPCMQKLCKRTMFAAALVLLCIPITIFIGVWYLGDRHYNMIAMLMLIECIVPFILVYEGRRPRTRELVTVAVLCAMGVAGRCAFFMLPQFKPVMALTIIAGVAFGGETGFLVGAVTMLVSNVMFSQGPWTPWQMFSMGLIGFLAGILFQKGLLRRDRVSLAAFGALSAVIIYGGIMNLASAIMWSPEALNKSVILAYYVTGLPMDLVHAVATAVFLMLAAEPMLEKLDRIKMKYGLLDSGGNIEA